jgi:hypothetical protein
MSTTELREAYRTIPPARRREMLQVLQELEAEETRGSVKPDVRSFDEAMDYTFTNFDNALKKLAQ